MCVALIAIKVSKIYPLIILHNRDEFYARESTSAYWHQNSYLAGDDKLSGGNWLGINRYGNFAFLTNYRDPKLFDPKKSSRGEIIVKYFQSPNEEKFFSDLNPAKYNHFNLITGNSEKVSCYSSFSNETHKLHEGIFAISNANLETPWPKVLLIKDLFQKNFQETFAKKKLVEIFFHILKDETKPPEEMLPNTHIPIEMERIVSSIFVKSDTYGTRCSNVILEHSKGDISFYEKTYLANEEIIIEEKFAK